MFWRACVLCSSCTAYSLQAVVLCVLCVCASTLHQDGCDFCLCGLGAWPAMQRSEDSHPQTNNKCTSLAPGPKGYRRKGVTDREGSATQANASRSLCWWVARFAWGGGLVRWPCSWRESGGEEQLRSHSGSPQRKRGRSQSKGRSSIQALIHSQISGFMLLPAFLLVLMFHIIQLFFLPLIICPHAHARTHTQRERYAHHTYVVYAHACAPPPPIQPTHP